MALARSKFYDIHSPGFRRKRLHPGYDTRHRPEFAILGRWIPASLPE